MKIVSSGKVLNSREFYKKKKRRKRIQLVFLSIGFLSVLSSLIYFSRQERFLVAEVMVLGEDVIDKEEIRGVAERLLRGYYFWIVPRANSFVYPRRTIERGLVEEFPRLKSADLDLSEPNTLYITVDERLPFALYCANASNFVNTSLSAQADKCYFLDEEGFIFALAPFFSGVTYFIYATENQIENPIGKRFVMAEEFKLLTKFIENLEALNIRSLALEFGDDEYNLFLSGGGQIKWRRGGDLTVIHSNLEAFLSDDSIQVQSNFLDKILYLDLRTENKVFYKFKD